MKQQIDPKSIEQFSAAFDVDPKNLLALNAVTKNGIETVALSREATNRAHHTYSHLIDTPKATNQKSSGRCWLFAGLNNLRLAAREKMKLEQFELSQTYLMFWDKLEKANFFLENILATRDKPLNGRLVMWLLASPVQDGGQWDMFVNLIKKYGVVPKSVMPETYSSSNSRAMNTLLTAKLRECAWELRKMHSQGASVEKMRVAKGKMVETLYRMISIHLGQPPSNFNWAWRDKDKAYHHHENITPKEFFKTYVDVDLDDVVCLINAPTEDKPYNKLYTIQYLGNVVGGRIIRYLNVSVEALKKAAADMIVDGKAVWFGCDVGKMLQREMGILDLNVYDYDLTYGTQFRLDKAGRLDYGHSQMTHAMMLTGVDLDEGGNPTRWRVENSWGTENGDKGYLMMTDSWFNEYLYEVAISKKYLPAELLAVLDTQPVVLPPWDPMGALAKVSHDPFCNSSIRHNR